MFFGKREAKVRELMLGHVQLVEKSVAHLVPLVEAHNTLSADIDEVSYEIHRMEHEADVMRRQIQTVLAEGAFLAFYREDYIILTERIDKIANRSVEFAKALSLERPSLPEDLREPFLALAKAVGVAMAPFMKLIESLYDEDAAKVADFADKVSLGEQEADSIEWKMKKKVYGNPAIERAEQIIVADTIERLGAVADAIENAADTARVIMAKKG